MKPQRFLDELSKPQPGKVQKVSVSERVVDVDRPAPSCCYAPWPHLAKVPLYITIHNYHINNL